jgi:hypothetical protein
VFVPVILALAAIYFAVEESWWALAALPFIWLGAGGAQPNLNFANGCLASLSMLIGMVVAVFVKPLGAAIMVGAAFGFYLSALEMWIRARPMPDDT